MSVAELLPALQDLDHAEKLSVMQFLVLERAREEGMSLSRGAEYPVWSPHGAVEAADTLLDMLNITSAVNHAER